MVLLTALAVVFSCGCTKSDDPNNGDGTYNGHAYVDLGLPSGTLWATCNVGADMPEGFGDYFACGETTPKTTYEWSNYRYCNGNKNQLTKYCSNANYGYNGFTDNLTALQSIDDAATANWGSGWCMPTKDQLSELLNYTAITEYMQNGVKGLLFTASNGKSLFLPAAGGKFTSGDGGGVHCCYWSCSVKNSEAWMLYYGSDMLNSYNTWRNPRYAGQSVRPVRSTH